MCAHLTASRAPSDVFPPLTHLLLTFFPPSEFHAYKIATEASLTEQAAEVAKAREEYAAHLRKCGSADPAAKAAAAASATDKSGGGGAFGWFGAR